jgi:hypothetical protein
MTHENKERSTGGGCGLGVMVRRTSLSWNWWYMSHSDTGNATRVQPMCLFKACAFIYTCTRVHALAQVICLFKAYTYGNMLPTNQAAPMVSTSTDHSQICRKGIPTRMQLDNIDRPSDNGTWQSRRGGTTPMPSTSTHTSKYIRES